MSRLAIRQGLALLVLPCLSLGCWLPPPLTLTREEPAIVEYTGDRWGQCNWFLARPVNGPEDYLLMEWTGWGDQPAEGDLLLGIVQPLESGKLITTEGHQMDVHFEAYDLDSMQALNLIAEKCQCYMDPGNCQQ